MRNYFKARAVRIYPYQGSPPEIDPLNFFVVFGNTDDQLLKYVVRAQADDGGNVPLGYFVGEPAVIWFEMNVQNLITLLNQASGEIWANTRLNELFTPPFVSDPNGPESLYDMTRVEIEGSPRKTWSHGE